MQWSLEVQQSLTYLGMGGIRIPALLTPTYQTKNSLAFKRHSTLFRLRSRHLLVSEICNKDGLSGETGSSA